MTIGELIKEWIDNDNITMDSVVVTDEGLPVEYTETGWDEETDTPLVHLFLGKNERQQPEDDANG